MCLASCQRPYGPQQYAQQEANQLTATICHNNRRTLTVSPEQWLIHREHGDYRGPCRERRIAGPRKPIDVKHTATGPSGNAERLNREKAAYEAQMAHARALRDSLQQTETVPHH